MKKILAILVFLFVLGGCAAERNPAVSISETDYKQSLGKAVCTAVAQLNEEGLLAEIQEASEEKQEEFAGKFDDAVKAAVNNLGYSAEEWLAAKARYFPDEAEHTKLVQMHFTWCLVGDSASE